MTQDFHLKPGYVERAEPHYFEDEGGGETASGSRTSIHSGARAAGRLRKPQKVIDIGCGKAAKLKPFFGRQRSVTVVGIDYGANISHCRERCPPGHWREVDLERIDQSPRQGSATPSTLAARFLL